MSVDILLAAYNGEKYIESQILSIVSQTYQNWNLIIHDDGSSDYTVEIVKKWANIDHRIILIEDGFIFRNPAQNFLHLLHHSKSELIMFCDQDDIWFDNKVQKMVDGILMKNNDIPQVLYSNSYVWKEDDGICGMATLCFPKRIEHFLFLNAGVQGCVAIFNTKMRELLKSWNGDCAMHDHLLQLFGLTFGEVDYIDIPLMLYRNHNTNLTGETNVQIVELNRIIKNRKIPVVDRRHFNTIERFQQKYSDSIEISRLYLINNYIEMVHADFFIRLWKIIKCDFRIYNSTSKLVAKLIMRKYVD